MNYSSTYETLIEIQVGNGIINEYIQAEHYPEFAVNNTYGIKAYNDTVYNYAKFATFMKGGCREQIEFCRATNHTTFDELAICTEAADMCRDNVESPYYYYGGRGTYDIRHPSKDPTPPEYFMDYLNLPKVQAALGVNLNYTESNNDIYWHFQETGDFIYDDFLEDLEYLLAQDVRVSLFYGDADYICNWFGGQAISLAVNFTHKEEFAAAGYELLTVNDTAYGEVRQYGNFSFTRIWEAGHEVPFYVPVGSLALFNRTINHFDIATGTKPVTSDLETEGEATPTHTEPFVALPSSTSSAAASASASPSSYKKNPSIPRAEPKRRVAPKPRAPKRAKAKRTLTEAQQLERRRPGYHLGHRFNKRWID